MSDLIIEVKNDGMLGRLNESNLHIELIKKDKEIERLKEELKNTIPLLQYNQIVVKQCIETNNYKSKINKAIEYIKSYNLPDDLGNLGEAPISIRELKELLKILGGDE